MREELNERTEQSYLGHIPVAIITDIRGANMLTNVRYISVMRLAVKNNVHAGSTIRASVMLQDNMTMS